MKQASSHPRVSIGLPVYNGELHLALALDSLLAQTFGDFELIISDNGSTDRTEEICRQYAASDARVLYFRNDQNRGAAWNYNNVFHLSRGEYFKWMAHDDLIGPEYLQLCVDALDRASPSSVLAFPRRVHMTWDGSSMIGTAFDTPVGAAVERGGANLVRWPYGCEMRDTTFAELLRIPLSWFPLWVFGLIRSDALRKTRMIGPFGGSDVVLVLELKMLGDFVPVHQDLFTQRLHPPQGWTMRRSPAEEASWFDPKARRPRLPLRARLYIQYLRSVYRVPISPWAKAARLRDLAGRASEGLFRRIRRRQPQDQQASPLEAACEH